MGVEYYNPSSSGSNSVGSPFYQPRLQTNPYNTYIDTVNTSSQAWESFHRLYGWRSGAGNYGWYNNSGSVVLSSISPSGVATTVATTALTSLLASAGQQPIFHQNSADQCVYFLLSDGTQLKLYKMNDTTGVFTAIGSTFTPTTIANWPTFSAGYTQGHMYVDTGTGHLKVICNGKYHLLNKSTGAIVSQDTAITLGAFNTTALSYFTTDGTIGTNPIFTVYATSSQAFIPRIVHSSSGHYKHRVVPASLMGDSIFRTVYGTIDSDKLVLDQYPNNSTNEVSSTVVLRSDYDKFIQSIYSYYIS